MATELGKAYVQIVPSAQGISGAITSALGGEASAAGQSAGASMGGSLVSSLTGIIAAAGIGKMVMDAITTGMDFDSAMSQVAATMGTTVDQIGELRDFAKEMGATTAFSATEAADALNYMALAGYDAETSMSMLPNVLNLAAAGGIDLARASDMVTDAQTALGLSLDETSIMVDQMAKASSKSNTSVEQLGDAFLTIGANARQARGGTAELSTVLGVLADNGIKGSEAGTHLRNIMLSMNPTTDKAVAAWEKLGVSAYDAEGNLKALPEVFSELNQAMEGMSEQEKTDMFSAMFNKTDLASIQALVGTSTDRFMELKTEIMGAWYSTESLSQSFADMGVPLENVEQSLSGLGISAEGFDDALKVSEGSAEEFLSYLSEMAPAGTTTNDILKTMGVSLDELQSAFDGASGAAQQMADTQLDNLEGDITLMKSAFEGVQIALSEKLMPGLRTLVQGGGNLLQNLTTAIGSGDWAAVGEILRQGLSDALNMAFSGLTEGLSFISENAGGIIAQGREFLTTFVTAIAENAPEVIPAAMDALLSIIEGSLEGTDEVMSAGESLLQGILDGIIAAGGIFMERAPEILMKLSDSIISNAQSLLNTGTELLQSMLDGFTAALPGLLSIGVEVITNLANGIFNALPSLISIAGNIVVSLADFIMQNLPTILEAGVQLLLNLVSGILDSLPELVTAALKIILQLNETLIKNLPKLLEMGGKLLIELQTGIINMIPKLLSTIADIIVNIVKTFSEYDWITVGKNLINGLIQGIIDMGSALIEAIVNLCKGALDSIKKFFGIESPSKVMAEEVGRYIPEGIAVGIEKYSGAVTDAMDDLKTDALDAAAVMDINTSSQFATPRNEAILARMDLMLALMSRYFPELEKQLPEGYGINVINRQLGNALI